MTGHRCVECGRGFTPPPLPAGVSGFGKWDQLLCPEDFTQWRAAQDQREAEDRATNDATCAEEGHVMFDDGMTPEHCLRCGGAR